MDLNYKILIILLDICKNSGKNCILLLLAASATYYNHAAGRC